MHEVLSGELHLTVNVKARKVCAVDLVYRSPSYSSLLINQTPEMALKRLRLLVSLCPYSQQSIAANALSLNYSVSDELLQREWIAAYCWQLYQIYQCMDANIEALTLTAKVRQGQYHYANALYGCDLTHWLLLVKDPQQLLQWSQQQKTPYQRLIYQLQSETWKNIGSTLQSDAQKTNNLLTLTLKRMIDLAQLLSHLWQWSLPSCNELGYWQGAAPRGVLMHKAIQNVDSIITDYHIITPTDTLCASDGPLIKSLLNTDFPTNELAQQQACLTMLVHAWDPCVPFSITLT